MDTTPQIMQGGRRGTHGGRKLLSTLAPIVACRKDRSMPLLLFVIMRRWVSTQCIGGRLAGWAQGLLGKITTEHFPTKPNQSIDPKQTKKHKKKTETLVKSVPPPLRAG